MKIIPMRDKLQMSKTVLVEAMKAREDRRSSAGRIFVYKQTCHYQVVHEQNGQATGTKFCRSSLEGEI
jgi:hypothetical protein